MATVLKDLFSWTSRPICRVIYDSRHAIQPIRRERCSQALARPECAAARCCEPACCDGVTRVRSGRGRRPARSGHSISQTWLGAASRAAPALQAHPVRRRYRSACTTVRSAECIGFDQRVGRTAHRAGDPRAAQKAARQRGFAGAQIAVQLQNCSARSAAARAQARASRSASVSCAVSVGSPRCQRLTHACSSRATSPASRPRSPGARPHRPPWHAPCTPGTRREPRIPPLRQHSGDGAGEHIAHARAGHAGIAPLAQARRLAAARRPACRRP